VSKNWPTKPVHLNHLEAMGVCMALLTEEERDGLSQPQRDALDKVQEVLADLLPELKVSPK
jgi:urease gamma subunit